VRRGRVDDRRLAVWETFLKAHSALAATLDRELEAESGMPLGWYGALLNLSRAPGGRMRMQELAVLVMLSCSGLTRLSDRLEAAGLINRETCPEDRRGTFAVITPKGRRSFQRAAPVHLRGIEEHFARHLTDDEAAALASALGKIVAAAEPGAPHGCAEQLRRKHEDVR
jgi:DNA-binding MarR family transcriptional regulator